MVLEVRWFQGDLKKLEDQVKASLQKGTVYMYDLRLGFIDSDSSYFAVSGRHPIFGLSLSVIDYSHTLMINKPLTVWEIFIPFTVIHIRLSFL